MDKTYTSAYMDAMDRAFEVVRQAPDYLTALQALGNLQREASQADRAAIQKPATSSVPAAAAEYNDWLVDEGAGDAKPFTDEELEDLEDDEPFQGDNQHDLVRDYQ